MSPEVCNSTGQYCPGVTLLTATVFKFEASSLTRHLTGYRVMKLVSEVSYKDVKSVELLQEGV
jgi:hypothetical protein